MIRIKGLSHEMKALKKHLSQSVTGDESFHKKHLSQSDPCGCTCIRLYLARRRGGEICIDHTRRD
jgi:hypothetical protein